jgi:serine/threonine protein kinase
MALASDTKLGPYEIIAPLGAGGMGEVYRARDTRLDRTVAIKILPTRLSSNPEAKQRFDREARAIRLSITPTSARSMTSATRTGSTTGSRSFSAVGTKTRGRLRSRGTAAETSHTGARIATGVGRSTAPHPEKLALHSGFGKATTPTLHLPRAKSKGCHKSSRSRVRFTR